MYCLRQSRGVRKRARLRISADVAELMIRLGREKAPRETGGVLVGRASPEGWVVTHATHAGPDAEEQLSTFRRDGEFTQGMVNSIFETTGGESDYLGEWHSHPWPVGPSVMDRRAMSTISNSLAYLTPEPLLIIVQKSVRSGWRLLGFQWTQGDLRPLDLQVLA